jgi:hypothetical protein
VAFQVTLERMKPEAGKVDVGGAARDIEQSQDTSELCRVGRLDAACRARPVEDLKPFVPKADDQRTM